MKEAYTTQEFYNYIDSEERANPENAWIISSDQVTIAGKLEINNGVDRAVKSEPETIARIQFYILKNEVPESGQTKITRTYVPAIYCTEMYSDWVDPSSSQFDQNVHHEFSASWVCPNITQIELYGDP